MGEKKKDQKPFEVSKAMWQPPANTKLRTQARDGLQTVTRSIALSSSSESLVKHYITSMVVVTQTTHEKLHRITDTYTLECLQNCEV